MYEVLEVLGEHCINKSFDRNKVKELTGLSITSCSMNLSRLLNVGLIIRWKASYSRGLKCGYVFSPAGRELYYKLYGVKKNG